MTVSHTCQKPIKFWAKCKINLLYKLNQSLLCVPGCPLSWQPVSGLGSHFPCPWSYTLLLCIHKSIPSPVFCPAWLVPIWPALPTVLLWCYSSFHGTCFPTLRTPALSAIPVSTVPHCLVPVCGPGRTPMLLLSIFLSLPRLAPDNCPLPFLQCLYVI